MQQKLYDHQANEWSETNRDPVVGSFDKHNAWKDYDEFLFKDIETKGKVALDFGCGPGRNIAKFADRFEQIDGADISQINLDKALIWCKKNNVSFIPKLYKSNGVDLSGISDNFYDIVFSTICLQHICVYDIRFNLFKEFFRVLKSDGYFCAQMGFGNHLLKSNGVKYYDNYYDAKATNGANDVVIEDANCLKKDLELIGFVNFDYDIRPVGPGDGHSNWIFFRAQKV